MKKIAPLLLIMLIALFTACKKDIYLKKEGSSSLDNTSGQPVLKLCEVRRDAAKTALAQRRGATSTHVPVILLLDFNGHTVSNTLWNEDGPLDCPAIPLSMLSAEQKNTIVKAVAEDFSGYIVKVTRDEQEYHNAPADRRMRCIITYNMGARFPYGGIAYIGSMAWADNTPCFVFCDNLFNVEKYIFNAVSHELGHTLGLDHQSYYNSSCGLEQVYHPGLGTGQPLSWSPIVGLMYYTDISTWHNGPTPTACDFYQNDMDILAAVAGVKKDDFGAGLNGHITHLQHGEIKRGILENAGDIDAFQLKEKGPGKITVISNGNSDIALEVYNQHRQLISVYDDPFATNTEAIVSGKNYIKVRISTNQPFVPVGEGYGGYSINVSKP